MSNIVSGGLAWLRRRSAMLSGGQMSDQDNPLREFFRRRSEGRGIWKWDHYFDIYHRHFSRFRGREVHVLEIGIYSGGSLDMWHEYFGPRIHVYGVDIEPSCKVYENKTTTILIGDQADRNFWQEFRRRVPILDIVIDDGGHAPEQQIVSIEELLPHLRMGGVYLCEDIHGIENHFSSYIHAMAHKLNAMEGHTSNLEDNERRLVTKATPFQSSVRSICLYPYIVVVEKTERPVTELIAPKHGTEWQPFLK
jgi:hypothetical protein